MAERKGSGGDGDGHEPVESGQQDDRSRVDEERETPAGGTADETEVDGTDLNDDDNTDDGRIPGSTDAEGRAEVIAFRGRGSGSGDGSSEVDDETELLDDDEDPDDEDLDLEDLEDPVDISAVQADDELLDALGGMESEDSADEGGTGANLDALLVAWRRDVDSEPIGDLVDTDTAVAAIGEGTGSPRRRKRRHLVPIASAAAVLMIAFTGVGVAARDAMPGDALWGVTQVLYTDYARSAQAASTAEEQLEKANTAWDNGKHQRAEAALKRARAQMRAVESDQNLSDLRAAHRSLSAKFDRRTESSRNSSAPPTSSSENSASSPSLPPSPTRPPGNPPPSSSQTPSTTPSMPSTSSETPSSGSTTTSVPSRTSGSTSDGSSSPWSRDTSEDTNGILQP